MDVPMLIGSRFELGSFLSQGGMGAVYRGRDTQTDNIVAIKQLKPDLLASDPDLVRRFVREGEALRALNHPNIVKLLSAIEHNGQYYLIMEYVSGGSLEELLRKTPRLPVSRVLAIALELADALTRAHHLKIIHRDIKPANVLLAEDGTPRLTDFGVARVGESDTTRKGTVIGTVAYVCPEALHDEALDARADLWSFGVMLYEMLAGRRPFGGSSTGAVVSAILNQRTPDLEASRPDAPVALVDLIYRMLEKSREQRIPSARLVGAELEGVIRYNWPTDANRLPKPDGAIPANLPEELAGETIRPEKAAATHIIALQNLPAQTTPFVGREGELNEIAKLLSSPGVRLVTILGPGGMGKTRLALEAVQAQLDHFANGLYFVNLAPLTSPDSILTALAEAVRFQFYQGAEPKQQILDYFREKHTLLLMDNFEHLVAGADLVNDILRVAPRVKVIATSRERLNLDSETLFRLGGMDFLDWETPEAALQFSVVKLFLQSARRVQPEFNVTADNLAHLARICRQVEGMPLGILLSAAWIETLSLKEISEEIDTSIDFLETERRDIPERQRSIRAVLDSSWKTLTENEQAVFKKLSVFRGGFTREAAQQAVGASLRVLTALLDKSVLRRDPQTGRYDIHDLLRQYGAEQLVVMPQEELDAQEAHCRHFASFMGTREPLLFRREQLVAMAEIRRDFDNVRVAWEVAIKRGLASEFRPMALCLFAYLWRSGPQEYEIFFASALEQWEKRCEPGPAEICLALALCGLGLHYSYSGRREKTSELFRRSLSLLRRYDSPHETLPVLLGAAYEEVDQAKKISLFQECLKLAQSIDNESWIGEAYMGLAQTQFWSGNDQAADALLQKADEAAQRSGDRNLLRNVLGVKANRTSRQGTYRQEADYVQQIVIYSQELGRTPFALYDASWLAHLEALQGNYETAAQQLDVILASARELGFWPVIATVIAEMTFAAYLQMQYEKARSLGQHALSMYRQHEATPWWFVVITLGHANAGLAAYKEAEAQYREAMLWGKTNQHVAVILESIIGTASLLGKARQPVRAVELMTLTYAHPSRNAWLKQLGDAFMAPLQNELPADVFAAAQERAKALDLDIVATEILNSPPIFPG